MMAASNTRVAGCHDAAESMYEGASTSSTRLLGFASPGRDGCGTRRRVRSVVPWQVLALVLLVRRAEAFQSPWVSPNTSSRVTEWLQDTSAQGSPVLHESLEQVYLGASSSALIVRNGQCDSKLGSSDAALPCVLPFNANISLLKRGAGETTAVDVSMDVYPGPRCSWQEIQPGMGSYTRSFVCDYVEKPPDPDKGDDESFFHHAPLRGAIVHDDEIATVIRIIFPRGFDASGVSVENQTMVLYNGSWTDTRVDGGPYGNETVEILRHGPYPVPVRRLNKGEAQAMEYGLAEPPPASRPTAAFGSVSSFRTGTLWALRDPEEEDGSFDGKRVVDLVTTESLSTIEAHDVFASSPQLAQRLKLRLHGLVSRRTTGYLGSSSTEDERIFAIQIYQTAVTEVEKVESGTADKIATNKLLMRYYNNHIKDPCLIGRRPSDGAACPVTQVSGLNYSVSAWFRNTESDEESLLCPPGTTRLDDTGLNCQRCPDGYVSKTWLATSCTECPPGTFADLDTVKLLGGGASMCRACKGGTYSGADPTSVCLACVPGSYSGGGFAECDKCVKGSISGEGASVCATCPPGTSTSGDGMSACHPTCLPGAAGVGGVEPCAACPRGTAAPSALSTMCQRCAPGSSTAFAALGAGGGAIECIECAAGSFAYGEASSNCTLCPAQSYQGAVGATSCKACPVDVRAQQAGFRLPQARVYLSHVYNTSVASSVIPLSPATDTVTPSLESGWDILTIVNGNGGQRKRTLGVAAVSEDQCFPNCLPGEASISAGLDTPGSPCTPCPAGTSNELIGNTACTLCEAGYYTSGAGQATCMACEEGSYADLRGSRLCANCAPGTYSPPAASMCLACFNGSYTPVPGTPASFGCSECQEGTYAGPHATACSTCPMGSSTLSPFAADAQACVSYMDDGVLGHWEMAEQDIAEGSRYARPLRTFDHGEHGVDCHEIGGVEIEPAAFRNRAQHGMPNATLRGPLCTSGTEWQASAARISVRTMLVNSGKWEGMQMDGGGVNTGLFVAQLEQLLAQQVLPTGEISVEVWFTIETDLVAGRRVVGGEPGFRGLVGALQKGSQYEKGWALSHWMDRNRGDIWYVGFELCVEANNNEYHDYNTAIHPGLSGDHGGLFLVTAAVSPAPAAGAWMSLVVTYSAQESLVRFFLDGNLIKTQRPCRDSVQGCGPILYPTRQDYWAHRSRPSHLTLGGIENVAGGSPPGLGDFYRHHGLLGMVKVFKRALGKEEAARRFQQRRSMYRSSLAAGTAGKGGRLSSRTYWVATVAQPDAHVASIGLQASTKEGSRQGEETRQQLSPSMVAGRVDWNQPGYVALRGGRLASVIVRGRFDAGVVDAGAAAGHARSRYRCTWKWASVEQSSVTGEVLDEAGEVLEANGGIGHRLRCALPDYRYGQTNQAVLTVSDILDGPLLQRVCLDRSCGYSPAHTRVASPISSFWWDREGVGALHGAKVAFSFQMAACGAGSMSLFAGAQPWCEACQAGKFANAEGAIACVTCGQGTWSVDGATACSQCPHGMSTQHKGAQSPDLCQPACAPGTFGEQGGLAPCLPCAAGTFASRLGSTACDTCPPGFTSPEPSGDSGATACIAACAPGQVGPNGTSPCTKCRAGSFAPQAGSEVCLPCSLGFYSTAGSADCSQCPPACEMALLSQASGPQVVALRTQCCQVT